MYTADKVMEYDLQPMNVQHLPCGEQQELTELRFFHLPVKPERMISNSIL